MRDIEQIVSEDNIQYADADAITSNGMCSHCVPHDVGTDEYGRMLAQALHDVLKRNRHKSYDMVLKIQETI